MMRIAEGARLARRAGMVLLVGAGAAACSPFGGGRRASPQPSPAVERAPARVPATVRLALIMPRDGSAYLRQYASAVVEGVRVAAQERDAGTEYRVELVIREISSGAEAAAAVREVSELGVLGIIGPLVDENVAAAAGARPDTTIVIVSPTAAEPFADLPNVYALNVPDTLGASALGEHVATAGLEPTAVLRPRSGVAQAQARAFVGGVTRRGGKPPLEVAYDPGNTNYSSLLRRLRSARVRSVFVAATEGDLRQFLPQVRYYGLGNAQVLATGPWATPDGLERIGMNSLEDVVTTLPFLPADSVGTWQQFLRQYESLHRRSLDSAIPALGYDAASLLLQHPIGTAGQVASRLRAGREVRGATGNLIPLRGSVGRQPVLVRITHGRPVRILAP